ncbi:MAG TPA: MOSC domain-containing protein [bacterium]|nr:MOSC domain-containing protein [bacterium]
MRIVSVNVARPRTVTRNGRRIRTAIFKQPVEGPVQLRALNLDGDRQADPRVHGGPNKAAYVYPIEHYAFWRAEFPEMTLAWGMFGENFTAEWMPEDQVHIGDRFRVGSAEVMVTEPRVPCYKLAAKFGRPDVIQRFLATGRTGFYLAVAREGTVQAGDEISLIERDPHGVTVADVTRLYTRGADDREVLARALGVPALSERWKAHLLNRISRSS